jgi:hypothetical protein
VQLDYSYEFTAAHHGLICTAPEDMYSALAMYNELKAESRYPVSACIVVLKARIYMPHLLQGKRLVGTFPVGTALSAYSLGHDNEISVYCDTPCSEQQSLPGPPAAINHAGSCSAIDNPGILRVLGVVASRKAKILLDTGASDNFISESFVIKHGLHMRGASHLTSVTMGGGTTATVTGTVKCAVTMGAFKVDVDFHVLKLVPTFDAILGLAWLKQYSDLQFSRQRILLRNKQRVVSIALPKGFPRADAEPSTVVSVITAMQANRLLRNADNQGVVIMVREAKADMTPPPDPPPQSQAPPDLPLPPPPPFPPPPPLPPHAPHDSDTDDEAGNARSAGFGSCGLPQYQPLLTAILEEFKVVFDDPHALPPMRHVSHCINTEPGARPPYRPMYRLTPLERAELERQVQELLRKGWIRPSVSPYGSPVLFVKKKDGSLRMCVDFRALNKQTVKNRYPLPKIDMLLDTLQGSTCFSSLDLHSGYHQVRLHEDDIPKTAFSTPTGHYEYMVLPMGLSNAPSTFMAVMNSVFKDMLGKFVLVYLDDILIYSKTPAEHVHHLRAVLRRLREHQLQAKPSKCEFFLADIKFLGHIVGASGVQVDPSKIAVARSQDTQ